MRGTELAKTQQFLEESCSMKVEVEESLLGPEDSEVGYQANSGRSEEQKVARSLRLSAQRERVKSW